MRPEKLPKKYLTETDRSLKRVSSEYANMLRKNNMVSAWLKNYKLLVLSTLPKRISQNFASFNFTNIKDQEIHSLFIYGNAGTGKSVVSAYYYLSFIFQLFLKRGVFSGITYNYVIFPEFIDAMQNDFKDKDGLMNRFSTCDILVLDDFGLKNVTPYVYSLIYSVINSRYNNMLPTIINSNFTLKVLGEKMEDDRIIRRIDEDYIQIEKEFYLTD